MKKSVFILIAFSMLVACSPMQVRDTEQKAPVTAQKETPATTPKKAPEKTKPLVIGSKTFDVYTLWSCSDYSDNSRIAFEIVKTDITMLEILKKMEMSKDKQKKELSKEQHKKLQKFFEGANLGFILFDRRKENKIATYRRDGLNLRWDWGSDFQYSLLLKPDGTGIYYDFTNAKGGKVKGSDVFKCEKTHE